MLDSAVGVAGDFAFAARETSALPIKFEAVSLAVGTTRILQGVDVTLVPGRPTVLMGPNGCGKTTLLKLAMSLIAPASGAITFGGGAAPAGSRAIVFQKPVMLRRTAAANVAYALRAAGKPANEANVRRLLDLAHIAPLAVRPARRLSGGEQQRLALARALASEPQVLLLDEPTSSLDPASTKLVEDIIAQVSASGVKVVLATHDIGQARRLAGDVVFLAKGRMIEHTAADRFFADPVSEEARRFLAGNLVI
ncbi:MAG: ATP-binding cassette domain-containing protein [Hyphomicrobiaceae bacterium]